MLLRESEIFLVQLCPWRESDRQGRNEGRKERERGGRKEGERKGGGGRREKVKEEGGRGREGRRWKREKQKRIPHCCARKNDQLTYHIRNLILLPSSSIVLLRNPTPGEAERGRKRGTKTEECGSNESRWAENRITTNIPLIIRTK